MTDTSHTEPAATAASRPQTTPAAPYPPRKERPAASGWIVFAGVMAVLTGLLQVIQGLVALFDPGYYVVGTNGLVVDVDYNAWGWLHLVIGGVAIAIGLGLIVGNTVARVAGVIVAGISVIANLAFIAAYPLWSVIVITIDVIVIYAIIVQGREMRSD
ncbi:MAG: hypothetical protein L0I76_16375 [Pseudonocardia sp.]|nr:hypothetical protein [Pseudonocardia sp.]